MKQLHSQIGGVVATLNDKVGKVLKKQEKEFLAAYRAHMYQVGTKEGGGQTAAVLVLVLGRRAPR